MSVETSSASETKILPENIFSFTVPGGKSLLALTALGAIPICIEVDRINREVRFLVDIQDHGLPKRGKKAKSFIPAKILVKISEDNMLDVVYGFRRKVYRVVFHGGCKVTNPTRLETVSFSMSRESPDRILVNDNGAQMFINLSSDQGFNYTNFRFACDKSVEILRFERRLFNEVAIQATNRVKSSRDVLIYAMDDGSGVYRWITVNHVDENSKVDLTADYCNGIVPVFDPSQIDKDSPKLLVAGFRASSLRTSRIFLSNSVGVVNIYRAMDSETALLHTQVDIFDVCIELPVYCPS